MDRYPFLEYINEDKSQYPHAKDKGYSDPDDLFLIGESGGIMFNIQPGDKFINTHLFTEVADYYRKNKKFTKYKQDSIPHRQFRKREQYRRKKGFSAPCLLRANGTIEEVRITGAHYNFLNYTRIEQLDESTIVTGITNTAEKHYDFPKFIDAQFWMWHCMEFSERNGEHLLIDKTRRGGFSYMMASDSANTINNESRKVVIHVAVDKKYLTMTGGLTDFSVNNLRSYEEEELFVRGVFSPVKSDFRLGYKNANGVEADKSWRSSLISVSAANNPNCAIGKDAKKVKVEEVSTMDNFDAFMEVTEPAMRTGAYTTGSLHAWGTATSGNMQVFEANFYNPGAYNFMKFENVWDRDSRGEVCGLFKPYCWGLQGEINGVKGMDKDGNSNLAVGLEIARQERLKKKESAKTFAEYINYLGQYANFPAESFSSASENIFSSEALTRWEEKLRTDDTLKFYVDGMVELDATNKVVFKSNARIRQENRKAYDWIQGVPRKGHEDPHGCIRRWFAPEPVEEVHTNGFIKRVIPVGLYMITYDPVGIDKNKKEITMRHSHNSIKVWMLPHESNGFKQKLVAAFYGRPEKLETADRICYLLAVMYNCVGNVHVEVNRGETVSNFKNWNALKYLAHEPVFIWDTSLKEKYSTTYGYVISDGIKKLESLRLLHEFLYEPIGKDENGDDIYNFHRIYDYQSILELKKHNDLGNFDRVSEMLIRGIHHKATNEKAKRELEKRKQLTEENVGRNDILSRPWF